MAAREKFRTSIVKVADIPTQRHSGGSKSTWGKWRDVIDQAIAVSKEPLYVEKRAIAFKHGAGKNANSFVSCRILTTAKRLKVKLRVVMREDTAYVWVE